jgi:hypothetical protein
MQSFSCLIFWIGWSTQNEFLFKSLILKLIRWFTKKIYWDTYWLPFFFEFIRILKHFIHFGLIPFFFCSKHFYSIIIISIVSRILLNYFRQCVLSSRWVLSPRDSGRGVSVEPLHDIYNLNLIETQVRINLALDKVLVKSVGVYLYFLVNEVI